MKTYQEAVEWIHSLIPFGIKPGLKRMDVMLERLAHPERKLKYIHVGGTNGKGSTVSFLQHAMAEAGLEVGTFTSPYIEQFNERISINGKPIPEEDLVTIAKQIRPLVDELADTDLGSPTEFEVLTTIALQYFATVAFPDVVLWEVGLGGRHDSTNVITPMVSIITNVGHDHMHILGETIEEIASEKAGIIKSGVPVITGSEDERALRVFRDVAQQKQSKVYELQHQFGYSDFTVTQQGNQQFSFYSPFGRMADLLITMKGEHQVKNASLAVMALQYLNMYDGFLIEPGPLRAGLKATSWLGRFEQVAEEPTVIVDGAHNQEGVLELAKTLQLHYSNRNIHLIVAATKEKDIEQMLTPLYPLVTDICFTSFDFFRAQPAADLYSASTFSTKKIEPDWRNALSKAQAEIGHDDVLIITGSLYFISEVRKQFK